MTFVEIPLWKGYLYSLMGRIKIYRQINSGQWRFGLSKEERTLLRRAIKKYVTKGGKRKPKAHIYNELINRMLRQGVATREELELVAKINVVKLINVEDLIMEMKQLQKFAVEVGIDPKLLAGKSEIQCAKMIVDAIEPEKEYPQDFIAWYDALPDGYFDNMDGVKSSQAVAQAIDAAAIEGIIEHVNSLSKVQEFKDVLNNAEVGILFKDLDTSKFKLPPQYKKAMIEHLEAIKANPDAVATESGEVNKEELAKSIMATKTVEDLIPIIEENQGVFAELETTATEFEDVKSELIKFLGVELAPPAAPPTASGKLAALLAKKKAESTSTPAPTSDMVIAFDPKSFDPNAVYVEAEKLQIGQLRKFYKQIVELSPVDIPSTPGMKKDNMLESIATGLIAIQENGPKSAATESAPETSGECALEITADTVKAAIESADKPTLVAMCDASGIQLNALQKKSAAVMGKLLQDKFPPVKAEAAAPTSKLGKLKLGLKKTDEAPAPASKAEESYLSMAFNTIERMMLEGAEESAIVDAVVPIFTAAGKKPQKLILKTRVKQLMEIISVEHGLKAKK